MSESELSKNLTKAIKALDKLAQDIIKDTTAVIAAARALKELGRDEKDKKTGE